MESFGALWYGVGESNECPGDLRRDGKHVLEDDDEEEDDEDEHEEDLEDQRPVTLHHVEELEQLAMRSFNVRLSGQREVIMCESTKDIRVQSVCSSDVRDIHVIVDSRDDLSLLGYHGSHARVHAGDLQCRTQYPNQMSPHTASSAAKSSAVYLHDGALDLRCIVIPRLGVLARSILLLLHPRATSRRCGALHKRTRAKVTAATQPCTRSGRTQRWRSTFNANQHRQIK